MESARETPILIRVLAIALAMVCGAFGALHLPGTDVPQWLAGGVTALAWIVGVVALGVAVFWRPRHARGSDAPEADRLRELIDGLDAVLFEARGVSGELTYVSRRIRKVTGYPEERWVGEKASWLERVHREDRPAVLSAFERAARKGGRVTVEYRLRHASGEVRWMRQAIHPGDRAGERRLLGWIEDITDRRAARRERLRSQHMESLSLLTGGIAHDFNNLLQGIVGSISLARQQEGLDPEFLEHLELTEQSAKKARALTQQLLDFSRGGSSERRSEAVNELVRQTVRFNLGGSNVLAELSTPDDDLHAEINDGEIRQALGNLVINADQAMPDGGTLRVTVARSRIETGDRLPLAAGDYVRIDLRDSGPGIPAEHLSRIFEPYFSTKPAGSGLGLANAFTIVRRHGGHIEVDSEAGVGTRFSVFLPAAEKAPRTEAQPKLTAPAGRRVLIMDDETIILNILTVALGRMGCRCERAENGDQAVELYATALEKGDPFDLVILDLTIPGGMGGPETLERIRAIDRGVTAIATSGYVEDPVMLDPAGYGFRRALPKPYDVGVLANALGEVLSHEGH